MAARPRRDGDTALRARRAQPVFEDFKPTSTWQEDNENHVIAVDLPGFVKDEIRVRTESLNTIRVSGERLVTRNRRSRFQEDFRVPENGEINSIRAKFQGGVLTITIPKKVVDMPLTEVLPTRTETPPKPALPKTDSPEIPEQSTRQKGQAKTPPAAGASQPTDETVSEPPITGDSRVKRDQADAPKHGRSGIPFRDAGRVLPRDLEIGEFGGRQVPEETREKDETASKVSQELPKAGSAMQPKLTIGDGAAVTSEAKPKNKEPKGKLSTHKNGGDYGDSQEKAVKELTESNEEGQLLVNMGVAVLIVMALSAYVTYKYTAGKDKN